MLQLVVLRKTQTAGQGVAVRFAAAFDETMVEQGRTNTWLAGKLNVSKATIGRYRSGEIEITLDNARAIEHALGLEPGELLTEAGYFEPFKPITAARLLPMAARGATAPKRGRKASGPKPPPAT